MRETNDAGRFGVDRGAQTQGTIPGQVPLDPNPAKPLPERLDAASCLTLRARTGVAASAWSSPGPASARRRGRRAVSPAGPTRWVQWERGAASGRSSLPRRCSRRAPCRRSAPRRLGSFRERGSAPCARDGMPSTDHRSAVRTRPGAGRRIGSSARGRARRRCSSRSRSASRMRRSVRRRWSRPVGRRGRADRPARRGPAESPPPPLPVRRIVSARPRAGRSAPPGRGRPPTPRPGRRVDGPRGRRRPGAAPRRSRTWYQRFLTALRHSCMRSSVGSRCARFSPRCPRRYV